jgi:hypothetical protein
MYEQRMSAILFAATTLGGRKQLEMVPVRWRYFPGIVACWDCAPKGRVAGWIDALEGL